MSSTYHGLLVIVYQDRLSYYSIHLNGVDWSMVCFFLGLILNLLLICELEICRYN